RWSGSRCRVRRSSHRCEPPRRGYHIDIFEYVDIFGAMHASPESLIVVGGGQSGLAAARAALDAALRPVVLEAGDSPAGSWPHYYDSLRLFSPARFSSFPGTPFPGDPDRYPTGREVADYLRAYAASLDVEIRTGTRVESVEADGAGFVVRTADGGETRTAGVVAATGTF